MTEIVPFQDKRKKQFPKDTTSLDAVTSELDKHFKKNYKDFTFGNSDFATNETVTELGKQSETREFSLTSFSACIASITSPALLKKSTSTLARLELPQLMLTIIARTLGIKRPFHILPKPYQAMLKRVYMDQQTLEELASFLKSKKKAKKYLRILHKRLGIYTAKKPPFVQASRN